MRLLLTPPDFTMFVVLVGLEARMTRRQFGSAT
jgi:hypothetical protein